MQLKIRRLLIIPLICLHLVPFAQNAVPVSVNTALSLLRSFKKEQRFWAIGQSTQFQLHFSPKDAGSLGFSYYTNGKFSNALEATAKSGATTPQQIAYTNAASMRLKELSIGWKHYLKGTCEQEETFNLYGYAGFGLVLGRIDNTHDVIIDTANYLVPVSAGKANFKRLTVDLGLGAEVSLGAQIYFFTEGRAWIPTTDYPSSYLFVNDNAPVVGTIDFGIRVLFD